jgi:predicted TIM-barrel fold metal-dependent hydrolase
MAEQKTIINAHSHIFTGDCVPPWLAKTILPWPLYFLVNTSFVVKLFRWWFASKKSPYNWQFTSKYKKVSRGLYQLRMNMTRYGILRLIKMVAGAFIFTGIFFGLYNWKLKTMLEENNIPTEWADNLQAWLTEHHLLIVTDSFWVKLILLIVLLLFFPTGKNLILFVLRRTTKFFKILPGKNTTEMIKRYITIIRFARYTRQRDIFAKLTAQYPAKTSIIVLPMDMEFMGSGKPMKPYHDQMAELAKMKEKHPEQIFPFVFVDPRRTTAGSKAFFDFEFAAGKVMLKDCFIKDYIETKQFSGFKIYPALGYFPFDEALLPVWKYAADNGIPVMSHCIRGVIYYRGSKKKEWDFHPVFKQAMGRGDAGEGVDEEDRTTESGYMPMLLPQMKNVEFQEIFTHPLNYLCLLNETLLRQLVAKAGSRVKALFGYTDDDTPLLYNLNNLKICFAHFGGDDEWKRYFEMDRDTNGSQLVKNPNEGIRFLANEKGIPTPGKPEQLWKYADWYSIICSLMLQYPNVYGDISYILHSDAEILPLLKQTLQHETLQKRVLFGTDFYVVRNHKSDKNMLSDMRGGLSEEEFDIIARDNPREYLKRKQENS